MTNYDSGYVIAAAEHILNLIEALAERKSIRVNEAAELLNVVPSTAHRLLTTLKILGYAVQPYRGGPYVIGPQLQELGLAAFGGSNILNIAHPILEELRMRLQETVNFIVLKGNEVHFLESIEGPRSVRVASRVGLVLPAHCTSGGKAILATLKPEELAKRYPGGILKKRTANTITSWRRFEAELESVRKAGYALNFEEGDAGIAGVGVCILDPHGRALASIAIAAPAFRLTAHDSKEQIVPALIEAAKNVEFALGAGMIRHESTHVISETLSGTVKDKGTS